MTKEVRCKDCSTKEIVPETMPEPWICSTCQKLHMENSAKDFDLEQEMERQLDDDAGNFEAWQQEESKHQGEF